LTTLDRVMHEAAAALDAELARAAGSSRQLATRVELLAMRTGGTLARLEALVRERASRSDAFAGDERACLACGVSLAGRRRDARFCSGRCRSRSARAHARTL
jgi:hypothetical protein